MTPQRARQLYRVAEWERDTRYRMGRPQRTDWTGLMLRMSAWAFLGLASLTVLAGLVMGTFWLARWLLGEG